MKLQEYLTLIDRFAASSLTCLKIKEETYKIHMEKAGADLAPVSLSGPQTVSTAVSKEPEPSSEEGRLVSVKAPLVGVFYAAPSPEEAPFVQVGSQVEKGQTLCLIEAMKMMNELQSPVSGTVRTIKGTDGQMAEYGQVLFEVEPC